MATFALGSLTKENVAELDKALANFATKKVDAVVLDLRAIGWQRRFRHRGGSGETFRSQGQNDVDVAQDFRASGPAHSRTIAIRYFKESLWFDRWRNFGRGGSGGGGVEGEPQTLLIGETSAGRAVEYSDFPLSSGKILRVAVGEIRGPDGQSLFPGGVKPDLPVELSPAQKQQIFAGSAQKGMAPFVFEPERPHFNEAALIAGTNPELDIRARRNPDDTPHDAVLQRAVDVITSLAVFQKH